jgi:hypothetical protein
MARARQANDIGSGAAVTRNESEAVFDLPLWSYERKGAPGAASWRVVVVELSRTPGVQSFRDVHGLIVGQ